MADGRVDDGACWHVRPGEDQRHPDRRLVEAELAEQPVGAGHLAVIAGVENPRGVREPGAVEGRQQ